jgi:hypothetical protein
MKWGTAERPNTTAMCDLDGDGKPELLLAQDNTHTGVGVWRNQIGENLACPGGSVNFTAGIVGNVYQWQYFGPNGFISLSDDANHVGAKSLQLKVQNIPSTWNNRVYRCMVDDVPAAQHTLILSGGSEIRSKATATSQVCTGSNFNVQFSVVSGTNSDGSVELWESKNNSNFQLVETKTYSGTNLEFALNAGSEGSSNKYFFKLKPTAVCATAGNSDTVAVAITKLADPTITVNNLVLSVVSPDGVATYQWQSQGTGASWNDISAGVSFTVVSNGTYRVKMTKGSCVAFSQSHAITIPTTNPPGVPNPPTPPNPPVTSTTDSISVRLYPNPTSGSFTLDSLKLSDQWETVDIADSEGRIKLSINIENRTSITIDTSYLPSGIYMAILRSRNGKVATTRFMKL